ncbi:MAG: CZB domain-containing protein [Capsulimonadaceae bacterium]|nr:CZB domain-containing protein [Capsulimonadaceae bacterium]
MTVAEIRSAIEQHDAWRKKLTAAIRTGTLADGVGKPLSVEEVSNDRQCKFGKWLRGTSETGPSSMPDYKDVVALNVAFHAEAGRVLGLALSGRLDEAEKEMAINSRFGKLSAAIMIKLTRWTTLFDTSAKDEPVKTTALANGGYHSGAAKQRHSPDVSHVRPEK